jgi:hypothetical protein
VLNNEVQVISTSKVQARYFVDLICHQTKPNLS